MVDAHIVYGFHAVTGRLRQDAAAIHEIYLDAARNDARVKDLTKLAASRGVRVMSVDALRLDGLTGHARHQGVAARVAAAPMKHDLHDIVESVSGDALLLVLDGVQDPHNLGACLRVAEAFGEHAVIAPKDRAVGMTPVVAKVASGAAETVPYITVTNLARTMRELKEIGIWIVGADEEASAGLYQSSRRNGALSVPGAIASVSPTMRNCLEKLGFSCKDGPQTRQKRGLRRARGS
jgi:23S rRNA (guanosine2251-2'-O)-methyltransferase